MSAGTVASLLLWGGVALLLGLLAYRFRQGAWSLEDEDIPAVSPAQRWLAGLALLLSALGAVAMVRAVM
jgi:Fe-S cluster assembly ATPase SufC